MIRKILIRLGMRCDHRNATEQTWRDHNGVLFVKTDCPDCGWHDCGHVQGSVEASPVDDFVTLGGG